MFAALRLHAGFSLALPASLALLGGVLAVPAHHARDAAFEPYVGGNAVNPSSTSSALPSVYVVATRNSSGYVQVLPPLDPVRLDDKASLNTGLGTYGKPTLAPLLKVPVQTPRSTLSPVAPSLTTPSAPAHPAAENIFQPVETGSPPAVFPRRRDHPAPKVGVSQESPVQTNKFYGNFFLSAQDNSTWTHPYILQWARGGGASPSWGMTINHFDDDMKIFANGTPARYFFSPLGVQSLTLAALELGASTALTGSDLTAFSANVHLSPAAGAAPLLTFPVVQGMGFVTGLYRGGTPALHSGVFFRSLTKAPLPPKPHVTKYTVVLADGKTWLIYAYGPSGDELELTVVNRGLIVAASPFHGIIQIAKNPGGEAEDVYDASCGNYATSATISGSAKGAQGAYTFSFSKAGVGDAALAMFALPHHVQSFSPQTAACLRDVGLATTTKGMARLVRADAWTMEEPLATTMGFGPGQANFSATAKAAIHAAGVSDISQDMINQTNLDSMYFSGKALAKFAQVVYVLDDLLDDKALAQAGLDKLKEALQRFVSNNQTFPLYYESSWGGIVSSATYRTNDTIADFGNTMYNDHHFHYGYFVYTAAIIGYLDPTWLPANKPWVQTLVRDFANPSPADPYFPEYRSFDWFHGHSWARGVIENPDGKDQESSSEDSMTAYALKLWGCATGDANMEARGNLQLAVVARSLRNYFLYTADNAVQPARFIGNKVSGILFENKIDHTTWFGNNTEYIHGIHMLPLLPSSALTRSQTFVQQEWDTYFSNGRVDAIEGGWRGVLYANLALIEPRTAWNFFTQPNFNAEWLDGGVSLTWYLTLVAGWGGAP